MIVNRTLGRLLSIGEAAIRFWLLTRSNGGAGGHLAAAPSWQPLLRPPARPARRSSVGSGPPRRCGRARPRLWALWLSGSARKHHGWSLFGRTARRDLRLVNQ